MADLDSMAHDGQVQSVELNAVLCALEDKFVGALTLVGCLEEAAGDRGPGWVYLLASTVRGLNDTALDLFEVVRRGKAS